MMAMKMSVGAVGGMVGNGNRGPRRKSVPVPRCSPQIPHGLASVRTLAASVGSQ
jgi:hypothetical protein